jgi:hypothetical protein
MKKSTSYNIGRRPELIADLGNDAPVSKSIASKLVKSIFLRDTRYAKNLFLRRPTRQVKWMRPSALDLTIDENHS